MYTSPVREAILGLKAYVPGKSIAEIKEKYGLTQVIKMASNENPLGTSPLVCEAVQRAAASSFRYPQGGNPRLTAALGRWHKVAPERIVVGNGSDEIIDLLLRVLLVPGKHSLACFSPCFSIYPIQGHICGVEVRRQPLREDFSFDFEALLSLVDDSTRLVFVTTPDNPSGYCPPRAEVEHLAAELARRAPDCLLVVDEAYMDFVGDGEADERQSSLLAGGCWLRLTRRRYAGRARRPDTAAGPGDRIAGAREGAPAPMLAAAAISPWLLLGVLYWMVLTVTRPPATVRSA